MSTFCLWCGCWNNGEGKTLQVSIFRWNLLRCWKLLCCLSDERPGLPAVSPSQQYLLHCQNFILFTFCMPHLFYVYTVYTRPLSAQAQYSRSCHIICSLRYNNSQTLERSYAWPLPSLSLLHFLCWALPCRILRIGSLKVKVESQNYITTYCQSASLSWCQAPIWDPRSVFLFSLWLFFRQLWVCWCGAPSLTRGRVCSFQFLPRIASAAFLRSESHGIHEHILLSVFLRLPQPGRPSSYIYFPQQQGSPVIPLDIGIV
jgi:hypothetical protein